MLGDIVPALVQNPLGMLGTGEFIRRADLVGELRDIQRRGIPVSVVWSDRDRLVPRSAFDDLRRAACVDGTVVEGSHGWLLAHPARFGELAIPLLAQLPAAGARTAKRRRREIHR
jgi:hypothetical protein